MKIALVNPPGKYRYIRDYYTSLIAKANYYYPPIDFVWLSASLEKPPKIFDSIAEEMSYGESLDAIAEFGPSHIFCLISGLSLKEDFRFIESLKERLDVKVIVMGDVCRGYAEDVLSKCPKIDAVLRSFACANIMDVLKNGFLSGQPISGWAFRSGSHVIQKEAEDETGVVRIGVPKWEIFPLKSYHFPFASSLPVGTVLTDYGCPFKCSYCSMGTLGWRIRELDGVIGEIDYLNSLGVKEVHFRDQTFGIDKDRAMSIMSHLKRKRLTWSCFSRVDIVSKELLVTMKDAGCHTVIFGIESGDYVFRQRHGKGIKDDLIIRVLKLCSELKINTVGTFIIGLPGERRGEVLKTMEFARSLHLDYASFNIAIPRLGSLLRSSQKRACRTGEDTDIGYERDGLDFMSRREAIRWAYVATRRFYIRPAYIINKLLKIDSFAVFLNEFKMGYNLLFGSYLYKLKNRQIHKKEDVQKEGKSC